MYINPPSLISLIWCFWSSSIRFVGWCDKSYMRYQVPKTTLNARTNIMMVHTCPFEPELWKSNLSPMSKQELWNELKQNSQSFVKFPALFAFQALANKTEDLVFHYRFHFSQNNPDQQCSWKRHGGDPHLRWTVFSLMLPSALTHRILSLGVHLRTTHVKRSCACFEKELAIEAGQFFVSGSEKNG